MGWSQHSTPHSTNPMCKTILLLIWCSQVLTCKPLYLGCWCGLGCNQARIALSHVITVLGPLYELCGAVGPISGNTATQRHTVSSTPHHSPQPHQSGIGCNWTLLDLIWSVIKYCLRGKIISDLIKIRSDPIKIRSDPLRSDQMKSDEESLP